MQLKGLIRFFTILLILYSLYELSYTWFVRGHEKKMESRARSFVKINYPETAEQKYPGNKDLQALYQDTLNKVYNDRLRRLLDSTKDVTITYGVTGKVSYQKAKSEELNLGLDLQGGINVTMEVELVGLLRSMANNSKDPAFISALSSANKRKANSNADFISLFYEEYKKIAGEGKLAGLFSAANQDKIKIGDSDGKVLTALRAEAKDAFNRTFRVLQTRIDQFGVAQPNINPDRDRGIITVELPGIQDKERVRKYLQSSANLQFWEVYNFSELANQILDPANGADAAAYLYRQTLGDVVDERTVVAFAHGDIEIDQLHQRILAETIDPVVEVIEAQLQLRSLAKLHNLSVHQVNGWNQHVTTTFLTLNLSHFVCHPER